LLALYFLIDYRAWRREDPDVRATRADTPRLTVAGRANVALLAGILAAVLLSGLWRAGAIRILGVDRPLQDLCRDALILLMGALSLIVTPGALRREQGALVSLIRGVNTPAHYFWAAGALSSFLDNAPTYLAFFSALLGRFQPGLPESAAVHGLIGSQAMFLEALAAGAVFMGANTYIGNAPNFMVRSIAQQAGVEMPSFFGYIFRWSLPILIPTFLLVTLLFRT
jgi:Na+/H+ antiporter NhaD/arsenite permease-like protein